MNVSLRSILPLAWTLLVVWHPPGKALADEVGRLPWWSAQAEEAVGRAEENAPELRRALQSVPDSQRASLQFLVENMPASDLHSRSAADLLNDVAQATADLALSPWASEVPPPIFLNDLLPYANVSERREPWREELRARCLPLVEGCTRPGEAAQRLNETLFDTLKVHYSTGRARADQSPSESLSSGQASCTGLSILLVDACRSVGVPARLVGIPDWSDGRGNHTWVEVWDAGQWHFLGAGEPDKRGLDHAWFERDAALAQENVPRHAIYAVSFRRTGLLFPPAWGSDSGGVSAENVTARYVGKPPAQDKSPETPATTRVMIRVRDHRGGTRVAARVEVTGLNASDVKRGGTSKDESADTNDLLCFDLPKGRQFAVSADWSGKQARQEFSTGGGTPETVEVALATDVPESANHDLPDPGNAGSTVNTGDAELSSALNAFFTASAEAKGKWNFSPDLDGRLQRDPARMRRLAWRAYRKAAAPGFAADSAEKAVRAGGYMSPYTVKTVGEKPSTGWGLVIALHGGGGAPREVNDSQWRIMQSYYRDQPQLGGYLYASLRAPNDTWNGFYDDYVYPLVTRLIRQFAVTQDMDLNKVFLIGYSHGGYGAFAIGPKLADRFAAIHSSAAAPTDGLISAKTLRNTPFDFTVGEFDNAYGRRERCEAFAREVETLRGARTDIFPVSLRVEPGRHHSDLPDRDQLELLLPHTRNPVPRELTWAETDGVIRNFYWLEDPSPGKGREIDAACRGNRLSLQAQGITGAFSVLLDERLVNLGKPLVVLHDGKEESVNLKPSLLTLCRTLLERGDPDLAFSCRLKFAVGADGGLKLIADTMP